MNPKQTSELKKWFMLNKETLEVRVMPENRDPTFLELMKAYYVYYIFIKGGVLIKRCISACKKPYKRKRCSSQQVEEKS